MGKRAAKASAVPFPAICRAAGLPLPQPEVMLTSLRRFRWDWAWPEHRLVLEVNGGIYRRGGHSTGTGILRDQTKLNCATLLGWRTIQVTPATLTHPRTLEMLRFLLVGHTPLGLPALVAGLPPQLTGSPRKPVTRSAARTSRSGGCP